MEYQLHLESQCRERLQEDCYDNHARLHAKIVPDAFQCRKRLQEDSHESAPVADRGHLADHRE